MPAQDLHADRALQPQGAGLDQHGPQPGARHAELGARDFRQGHVGRGAGGAADQRVCRSRRDRVHRPDRYRHRRQRRRQERDPQRGHARSSRLCAGHGRGTVVWASAEPAAQYRPTPATCRRTSCRVARHGRSKGDGHAPSSPPEPFVERSLAALCDHGNTLSIASTGFGKTIALSAVSARSSRAARPRPAFSPIATS